MRGDYEHPPYVVHNENALRATGRTLTSLCKRRAVSGSPKLLQAPALASPPVNQGQLSAAQREETWAGPSLGKYRSCSSSRLWLRPLET